MGLSPEIGIQAGGGGGTSNVTATGVAKQVAVFNGAHSLVGYADLIYDPVTKILNLDSIQFSLTPTSPDPVEGKLVWNTEDGTLNLGLPGGNVNLQIGQETLVRVKNDQGADLANGTVVYFSGADGANVLVKKAIASAAQAMELRTLGMTTEPIVKGQHGYVTIKGNVHGVDTNGMTAGDVVYLSATTAGSFTTVAPTAPDYCIKLGGIVKSAVDGIIFISQVRGGEGLNNLHDVLITGALNGDILQYVSANSRWQNTNGVFAPLVHTQNADTIIIPNGYGSPSFNDVQDFLQETRSAGRITGGVITAHSPADGTVDVSSMEGMIFTTNVLGGAYIFFKLAAASGLALTDKSVNWVYLDWNGGAPRYLATTDRANIHEYDQFAIGRVWRDGTAIEVQVTGHNIYNKDRRAHNRLISKYGNMDRVSGGVVSAHATALRIQTNSGSWYTGNVPYTTPAADTFKVIYRTGGGDWVTSASLTLFSNIFDGGTSTLYTKYQNGTSLGNLGVAAYGVYWVYLDPYGDVYIVLGTSSYATIGQAQAAAVPASLPPYSINWARLIGKVICQNAGASLYSVESIFAQAFTLSTAVDHASLSNLAYSVSGHTGFEPTVTKGNLTGTSPIVVSGSPQIIGSASAISMATAYMPRERLSANRTYYVRTDGNDSNTGLANNAAGAFLTIQKAVDVYQTLDCYGYDVIIQVADGTYTGAVLITARVGAGNLYITGNTVTPSNVLLNVTGNNIIHANGHPAGSNVIVSGFKMQTTTSGSCLRTTLGSQLTFSFIEFGTCASYHIEATRQSIIFIGGNYTISGGAVANLIAHQVALITDLGAYTVTVSGTPAFSVAFVRVLRNSFMYGGNATFSGSATGKRYDLQTNGVLDTNGGGANFYPGNVAGTAITGGQYL